ncbi:chemotaxis protein [Candidatus Formimonas warabiya]|uniref:Chemotaxis protein n=2 Tax=Formimonas warabiya TaxID=1761012 RepID=A0A3G1KUI8_FORW1|nr:chemotaxis protein [Candidatus Formimonas warabiya]
MVHITQLESFKQFAAFIADLVPGGVVFTIVEGDQITWKLASQQFDLSTLQVGSQVSDQSVACKAIAQQKELMENVPRTIYGTRITEKSIPFVNDKAEIMGALSILIPRTHPVARAFPDFAPLIAEMFPEGAFLYFTDLETFTHRQGSEKFDIPRLQPGKVLKGSGSSAEVIRTGKPIQKETDASVYGVPALVMTYPVFDEDDKTTVVGTFGLALPKQLSSDLHEMADKLSEGMEQISAAVEQLAGSASQINVNESALHTDIQEMDRLSDEIDSVLDFIKQVADQTKMLGLNAAIEAARAGQAGAGFSVVAEEIRKLSDQSKDTVVKIRSLTKDIKSKVETTVKGSETILASTQEQAAASEEITASVETMSTLAQKLNEKAKSM